MLNELYYKNISNFEYDGICSKDYGLIVNKTQNIHGAPKPIVESVNVPGRGNIIIDRKADPLDNDEYEDISKVYQVHMIPDSVAEQSVEIVSRAMFKWLYKTTAYKELKDSYEPGYYRKAYISEMITVDRIAQGLLSSLAIPFTASAYKYLVSGKDEITLTTGGMLYNPEGFTASPLIIAHGSGNIVLTINDRSHIFSIDSNVIYIDSEKMNSYDAAGNLKNSNTQFTYYPKLVAGTNDISWTGNLTKLVIIPRWCTL
ncbi:MAG: hypothetical protein IJZ96_06355 [Lachnospiraceae bacterium]|nr:hypothetical protein [Lachnospiraceae bacterium]